MQHFTGATIRMAGPLGLKMDRRNTLMAAGSGLAVALVLFLVVFGRGFFELDQEGVNQFLLGVQTSPWSFLAVAVLFVALALVGFPQTLLYAGTVAVFGGWQGALYGWAATLISSAVTFHLGKFVGGFWVTKISEGRAQALIRIMQERGLVATMVVRWLPTAPMVVVNAICGASGMALWKFMTGTSLGIIPKIALIAFFTQQVDDMVRFLTSGDPSALMTIFGLAVAWIGFMLFCRWLYRRLRSTSLAGLTGESSVAVSASEENKQGNGDLNSKSKAQCDIAP